LYSSLKTVTIISEETRWVEHVKYTKEKRNTREILLSNHEEAKA
jgi:hypothetical protein